jgi:pimeloyl-ACP methyl ester carboxylesterase
MLQNSYPYPIHNTTIHENISIAYMDEGKGEQTLLFLHGLANYAPVWKYQLEALSKSYRCIAVDLPGNGYSSRGDYPYSMFFYAECVVRFIEKLELKNIVLCGHSMGGQIALVIALRYPHLLHKLVLVAPAGLEYFQQHEVLLMQSAMNMSSLFYSDEFHLESAIKQSFFNTANESGTIIDELKQIMQNHSMQQWRDMSLKSINGMLNEQVQQYLHNIEVTTLVLFGDQDRLIPNTLIHFGETPEGIAKKATGLMPNAHYKLIKHAGHFVQIEKAGEVNTFIQEFLTQEPSGA